MRSKFRCRKGDATGVVQPTHVLHVHADPVSSESRLLDVHEHGISAVDLGIGGVDLEADRLRRGITEGCQTVACSRLFGVGES